MTPENDKSPMPPEITKPVPRGFAWQKFGFLLALLALLLSGGQWLETRQKLNDAQQEMARRLAEADVGQKGRPRCPEGIARAD
jgi:uroporphyrin-3 C-methyltransferase